MLAFLFALALSPDPVVTGRVVDPAGRPVDGAIVTARAAATVQVSVYADAEGRFTLPVASPADVRVRAPGYRTTTVPAGDAGQITLNPAPAPWRTVASNRLLSLLPDGPDKRQLILDCTGCHQFDATHISAGDSVKDRATWQQRTEQMIGFAGASAGFPVMARSRDAVETAILLSRHVTEPARNAVRAVRPAAPIGQATLTEFAYPIPNDLPHDVALTREGHVLVTGMFSHQMWTLDPATGTFTPQPIPVQGANPRAVEVGADGAWWVLLGGPQRIARFGDGVWQSWNVGMYGHSIGLTADGRAWTNGHFTQDPELIAVINPATDSVRQVAVPTPPSPDGGRNIQYELRVAPDGAVWMSQLAGNRMIRYEPATGSFRRFEMPTPHSGPRRFDIAPDGTVWIPEYASNHLTRLDPRTGQFRRWELPVNDALPYVVRVDAPRNVLWIGTGAADAMIRFDLATESFTMFPTPSPGSLIRHFTIDPATGVVWAAYGASPAREPVQILRIAVD